MLKVFHAMKIDEQSPILTAPDYIKWSLLRPSSLLDEKSATFKDLENQDFRRSLLTTQMTNTAADFASSD